jgi:general secretion pathway protein L
MMSQALFLIQRAWRWWLAEFLSLLPLAYFKRLVRPRLTLLLRSSEAMTRIALMDGDQCLMLEASVSEETLSELKGAILAAAKGKRFDVIGVIPDQQRLIRPLTLPLAAKGHIEEAVRYQIERISPFKAHNTLYGIELLESDPHANELHLKLSIVATALVEDLKTRGARLGFPTDGFAIESAASGALEALAFSVQGTAVRELPLLATKALLAASLVFLASFLLVPILGKWKMTEALEKEVALLKPKADQVLKLQSERDKVIALRARVIGLKRASLPPVAILSKLSDLLEDESFLFELRMQGTLVTISGLSADASKLAQRLGAIEIFKSVKFSGPVTRDAQAARDRFTLILELAASS